ncbi:SIMPL domain-containing protein [Pelagibaculum spongiae]|nr:SIMPL domain-containing protein [Pelagibaculum spongiae]
MKKLALAVGIFCCGIGYNTIVVADQVKERISVFGQAQVEAVPDQMLFHFSVVEEGGDLKPMQRQVNQKVDRLLKLAKKLGLQDRDIKAARVNIGQIQRPLKLLSNNSRREYEQVYRLNRQVTFRLRDLSKFPGLLDGAVAAGANQLTGIEPAFDDRESLYRQALVKAMKAATQKATLLAKQTGQQLGGAVSIRESGSNAPQPQYRMMAEMSGSAAAAPFAAGTEAVSARVDVEFSLQRP